MKKYKKYIDDLFREKVAHESKMPPDDVWESLDKKLDGMVPSPPPASYRWLHYFAIASLVLLLTVLLVKKIAVNAATRPATREEDASTKPVQQVPATGGISTTTTETTTGNLAARTTASANNITAQDKNTATNTAGGQKKLQTNTAIAGTAITVHNSVAVQTQGANETKNKIAAATHSKKQRNSSTAAKTKHSNSREAVATTGNATGAIAAAPATPPDHSYNGSYAGDATTKQAAKNTEVAAVTKQTPPPPEPAKEQKLVPLPTSKHKNHFNLPERKLEEGIKAGYEGSNDRYAASKYTVSPYLQFNLSSKISLLFQPAVKYAQLSTRDVGSAQQYYSVNNDGTVTQNGASVLSTTTQGSTTDSIYTTKYTYRETHDSIVKSYSVSGAYLEFELPVLLKYYLTKKIAVFGGVNLLYSKFTGINENTYTQHGIASSVAFTKVTSSSPTTLPVAADISYTGAPYSSYNGPLYHTAPAAQFHLGYMVGFSYEYNRRWLVDGLVEQSPVNTQNIGGYNMSAPLSSVYFRLAIGYRLQNNLHIFGKSETGRGD